MGRGARCTVGCLQRLCLGEDPGGQHLVAVPSAWLCLVVVRGVECQPGGRVLAGTGGGPRWAGRSRGGTQGVGALQLSFRRSEGPGLDLKVPCCNWWLN